MSDEQKAHDLTIAFVTYVSSTSDKAISAESFYQDYENNYPYFLNLVKTINLLKQQKVLLYLTFCCFFQYSAVKGLHISQHHS